MILVFLKDGATVYGFENGEHLRRVMHERPGHKPPGGGTQTPNKQFMRSRETGELVEVPPDKIRYLNRQTVSHVIEADPPK